MTSKLNLEQLKQEYIGKSFSWLTIIDVVRDGRVKFICRCKCGIVKSIDKNKVLRGDIISCGCFSQAKRADTLNALKEEYVGKTFNWLTIIDVFREDSCIKARCRCRCGNEYITTIRAVTSGHTTSCGCYRRSKEKAAKYSQWCKNHPEAMIAKEAKRKQYFKDHPEKVIQRVEKHLQWRAENPDKIEQLARQHSKWWHDNPEIAAQIGSAHSQWFKDNPEKVADMVLHRKDTIANIDSESLKTIRAAHSKKYSDNRILLLDSLKNTPTSDFLVLLSILHESQIESLLNGKISSHDNIKTKCPVCGTYCDHMLKNTFVFKTGTFKHGTPPMCPSCVNNMTMSKYENEIADFISTFYSGEVIKNSRNIIFPYELDLYYPEKKIAVEYNGDYWHSERFKSSNYHYNKFIKCRDSGILLISVFGLEWDSKKEAIKSYMKDTFNDTKNRLSFLDGYMNNNYPCVHAKISDIFVPSSYTINDNLLVYTCGFSKIL